MADQTLGGLMESIKEKSSKSPKLMSKTEPEEEETISLTAMQAFGDFQDTALSDATRLRSLKAVVKALLK